MNMETGITSKSKCSRSGRRSLEKIRSADFENVMLDQFGDRNLKRFITVAKEVGLKVPFVHMDCSDVSSIWTPHYKQKEFLGYAQKTIEICGEQGVETVIMHPAYSEVSCAPTKMGRDNVLKLLEIAKKNGVKIALENIDEKHMKHFEYLLKEIKSPDLGFCFDSGHWNLYTPEIDLLEKYGDRLIAVHIQDNIGKQQSESENHWDQDLHMLPFDGNVDFDYVAKGIAKSKYNGPLMLESHRSKKVNDYRGLRPKYFLDAAHNRAMKLTKMIQKYRNQDNSKSAK